MPKVIIYSTPICPYCVRAKQLLKKKGVAFDEVDVLREPGKRAEMLERSHGRRTVPQIFIGDTHIGGCDDLYELEHEGKLAPLLAEASQSAGA
jgi:glutaredoxin 3